MIKNVIKQTFNLIPYQFLMFFGSILGILSFYLLKKRKKIATNNIRKCFPKKSEKEINEITKKHFRELGKGIFELFITWTYTKKKLKKITSIQGLENIDKNKGAILLSGHFTHVELASRIIGLHLDNPRQSAVLYVPVKNKSIEKKMFEKRMEYLIPIPFDKPLKAVKHLRQKKWLFLLPDESFTNKNRKISITFFKQNLNALTSTTELAKMGQSKVYPCFCYREKNHYQLKIEKNIETIPSSNIRIDTEKVFQKIENEIKKQIPNYFWVHQIFKT